MAAEAEALVGSGHVLGCGTGGHRGCLAAGGATVAVLAHGLDHVYPPANRDLAKEIVENGGALVSEYPPGEQPRGHYFIERDRLQSGLSDAVIVIESGVGDGTMHTARFAGEQGRPLACVVHPATAPPDAWAGNRLLLERGASPLAARIDLEELFAALPRGTA